MNMQQRLINYVKAGYPGLYLLTHEDVRAASEMKSVADAAGYKLFIWSATDGIVDMSNGIAKSGSGDPVDMLGEFVSLPQKSILLAKDYHLYITEPNPFLIAKLKDSLAIAKASNRLLVITGCVLKLLPELEKELTVVEFSLPDRVQLGVTLKGIKQSAGLRNVKNEDAILDAASGLTTLEAENAFALSIIESNEILPTIVAREKAATVKKNGILEIMDATTSLDDIGGLEYLKADLFAKRNLFTRAARDYGLPTPRPLLVVGQAGTGKSLAATATGNIFGIPLIKLESGKLFGSLVGQSEMNWRTAFGTAKAIAPCVLWIDEVDGLFSGSKSSGTSDGGTTSRVIKAVLQDIQYNSDGVFFMFTANDIDNLPDPLIDRCDVWYVDLPAPDERKAIWEIHIAKRGRDAAKLGIATERLSDLTNGFSGRQIEQAFVSAMTIAFNDGMREPTHDDCDRVAKSMVPTSVTMAEEIKRRRERLANRARPANKAPAKPQQRRSLINN